MTLFKYPGYFIELSASKCAKSRFAAITSELLELVGEELCGSRIIRHYEIDVTDAAEGDLPEILARFYNFAHTKSVSICISDGLRSDRDDGLACTLQLRGINIGKGPEGYHGRQLSPVFRLPISENALIDKITKLLRQE